MDPYMDVVFPQKNEEEFARVMGTFGIRDSCFVYTPSQRPTDVDSSIKMRVGFLLSFGVRVPKGMNPDFVFYQADEHVRSVIERKQADIIFDFEYLEHKDKLHYRNSGMNQVLAKLMHSKGVRLGISFSRLLHAKDPVTRALAIGRIRQNLMLARKYTVDVVFASFATSPNDIRSAHDLRSFFDLLDV